MLITATLNGVHVERDHRQHEFQSTLRKCCLSWGIPVSSQDTCRMFFDDQESRNISMTEATSFVRMPVLVLIDHCMQPNTDVDQGVSQ
jgi:hypothetical protein